MKKSIAVTLCILSAAVLLCSCAKEDAQNTTDASVPVTSSQITDTADDTSDTTAEITSETTTEKENESDNNVGVVWESEDCESAEDISKKLGIELHEPVTEGTPQYMIISGQLGQIDFISSGTAYCLRAAAVSSGLRGSSFYGISDANFTSDGETRAVDTAQVTFKTTIDGATVAVWQVGNAMYSLFSSDAAEEAFEAVLEAYIA